MSTTIVDPHRPTSVSQACIDIIKRNEGCELKAYLDTIAKPPVWTIGFGDTLGVRAGMTITQREAEQRLLNRINNEFCPGVLRALKGAPVTQSQLDAMVSLAYNIGIGRLDDPDTPQNEETGFHLSRVRKLHMEGRYTEAADAFRAWNKAGGKVVRGLARRREEERELYLKGTHSVNPPPKTVSGPIVAIQEVLVNAGKYPKSMVDGLWGPRSEKALRELIGA